MISQNPASGNNADNPFSMLGEIDRRQAASSNAKRTLCPDCFAMSHKPFPPNAIEELCHLHRCIRQGVCPDCLATVYFIREEDAHDAPLCAYHAQEERAAERRLAQWNQQLDSPYEFEFGCEMTGLILAACEQCDDENPQHREALRQYARRLWLGLWRLCEAHPELQRAGWVRAGRRACALHAWRFDPDMVSFTPHAWEGRAFFPEEFAIRSQIIRQQLGDDEQ